MSERASTKGRDLELASASYPQEPSKVRPVGYVAAYHLRDLTVGASRDYVPLHREPYDEPVALYAVEPGHAAVEVLQGIQRILGPLKASLWNMRRENMLDERDRSLGHIETIEERIRSFMEAAATSQGSGRNRADATPKNPLSEGRERS